MPNISKVWDETKQAWVPMNECGGMEIPQATADILGGVKAEPKKPNEYSDRAVYILPDGTLKHTVDRARVNSLGGVCADTLPDPDDAIPAMINPMNSKLYIKLPKTKTMIDASKVIVIEANGGGGSQSFTFNLQEALDKVSSGEDVYISISIDKKIQDIRLMSITKTPTSVTAFGVGMRDQLTPGGIHMAPVGILMEGTSGSTKVSWI